MDLMKHEKSMRFIRRLNRGNFILQARDFKFGGYKISAQYLQNYVC